MNSELLKKRTKDFAHRCVKAAVSIEQKGRLGKIISNQLMRCSTSVAANYRAVCLAHSKDAFAAKLSIVIEEVDEAEFWMSFAVDENLFKSKQVASLVSECKELLSIFISARKTIQKSKLPPKTTSNQ